MRQWFLLIFGSLFLQFQDYSLHAQSMTLSATDEIWPIYSDSNSVSVDLENAVDVHRVQFHLGFDAGNFKVIEVRKTERTEHLTVFDWKICGDGIMVSMAGEDTSILAGSGSVVSISCDISENALTCKKFPLTLSHVKIDDLYGREAYQIENGSFCVYNIPDIIIPLPSHDFGPVGIGCSSQWVYAFCGTETWEPQCCEDRKDSVGLTVLDVVSDHTDFMVTSPTFPQTMSPGECIEISVIFTPSTEGHITGTLAIRTDNPDEGIESVECTGRGTTYLYIQDLCDASGETTAVSINMNNAINIIGGQWDFVFSGNRITITGILTTERSLVMDIFDYSDLENGIRIAFTDIDGDGIGPVSGPIFEVHYDLAGPWSCSDSFELRLEGVALGDTADSNVPVIVDDGWLFFWSKGDVNLDCEVNVLDVVQGVRIILRIQDPKGCHEWAVDVNSDGIVNLTDIIEIVNRILDLDEM